MFTYLKGRPATYVISSLYGFVFALFFIIYGGIKVILSFLDNNFAALRDPIIFAILGLVLLAFAIAYRELKNWGWYGLIAKNGLVVLFALFGFSNPGNIALLIISGIALYGLLAPATRECLAGHS